VGLREKGRIAIKWNLVEKFLKRGVTFIISIFLARLLEPSDFGLLAMISVFTAFAAVFYDFGLGQALIQKKEVSDVQFSTVFFLNVVLGIVVYLLMWFVAPFIASFYENPILIQIIRVSTLTFIFGSTTIVSTALLTKTLNYKVFAKSMFISSVLGGTTGVVLAFLGYGVWSLVFYSLISSLVNMFILWFATPWRPIWAFDFKSIKEIWRKGLGFMNLGIINNVVSRIDNLFIGKVFNANMLGLFNRAKTFWELPQDTFLLPVTRPMFPVFAQIQDEPGKIKESFFQMFYLLNFSMFLVFGIMYLSAENIIVILYSDKWIESVPFLKVMLLLLPILPFSTLITSLLKGVGKIRLLTLITVLDRFSILLALFFGIRYGLLEYLYALVSLKFLVFVLRVVIVHRLFQFGWLKTVLPIFKPGLLFLIPLMVVKFVSISNIYLEVVFNTLVFLLVFIFLSYLLKIEGVLELKAEVRPILKKLHRKGNFRKR
jgi:O-antigen/teichoic acid export membrane protein